MAMQGVKNHGGRSVTAATNAKTPQRKISTQAETTIFCAAARPTRFATRSSATSKRTFFHCFARYNPGACPFSINCASHELYAWLARSPASMRRCHKHGITSKTDKNRTRSLHWRTNQTKFARLVEFSAMLTQISWFWQNQFALAILLLRRSLLPVVQ